MQQQSVTSKAESKVIARKNEKIYMMERHKSVKSRVWSFVLPHKVAENVLLGACFVGFVGFFRKQSLTIKHPKTFINLVSLKTGFLLFKSF